MYENMLNLKITREMQIKTNETHYKSTGMVKIKLIMPINYPIRLTIASVGKNVK